MRLAGDDLKKFYRRFEKELEIGARISLKWETGEKGRVKKAWAAFVNATGLEGSDLEENSGKLMDEFFNKVRNNAAKWRVWKEGNRANMFGSVLNRDSIVSYANRVGSRIRGDATTMAYMDTDKIVGGKSREDYEF